MPRSVHLHTAEAHPSADGSKRGLLVILVVGAVCLLVVLVARHRLYKIADQPAYHPPPPHSESPAPFIATPERVVARMVELAGLKEGDLVYDLGCGDGRIVITAVLKSGGKGIGFDIDPERVAEAKENARLHGVEDRVQIVEQDIFTVDFSKADVLMMYLLPWMMNKLPPQIERMKPGCRVVSHDYWIDGVVPDEIVELPAGEYERGAVLFLYVTPLKTNPAMERGRPPRPDDLPSPQADGRGRSNR